LSRGEAGSGYHSGYVQDAIFSEESGLNEKFVFACGSMAMIESVSDLFNQNGLPQGNFFSDAFVASSP
jgi:CDP-4-dehydro-6-deoxyglucose reductase